MKKVEVLITMTVSDEYYEKEIKKFKQDIACGKHQREICDKRAKAKGLLNYKAFIKDV